MVFQVLCLLLQPVSYQLEESPGLTHLRNFQGFAPKSEIAVEIARPVFRYMLGSKYLDRYEPLVARSLDGRWVVSGKAAKRTPDEFLEPYTLAIDPWSCRVVIFGVFSTEKQLLRELSRIPLDRRSAPKSCSHRPE